MIRLNITNQIYNDEPIHITIAMANSTIYDNINNICTHIAYNINKYKSVNNVINIQLIFDYPKIKSIKCDIGKMYYEMSKIMKSTQKNINIDINFIKMISSHLEENNHMKSLLIYVEGSDVSFYHQNIIDEFNNIKTKINNNIMTCIRINSINMLYELENTFDNYITLNDDNLLFNIKNMNIYEKDCIKIIFNNDYFIGFDKSLEYDIYDNLFLIPYEIVKKEECNYNKYFDMVNLNYTLSMTNDDITIYELCDIIWVLYNNLLYVDDDIKTNNYKKYILSYEYLNKKMIELHDKARKTSNNDEYRGASFGQYYLNLINEQLIKIEINNKKGDNEMITEITEYYNKTENKFNNKQIQKKHMSTIKKNIDIIVNIKKEIDIIKNKYHQELNEYNIESFDFFTSNISLTNWLEEIEIDSSMGLLYKINTSELGKIGFLSNLQILNTTTTFISTKDYLDSIISRMKITNSNGNLNNLNIFTGDNIGDSNAVIPIYINKHHWEIASTYIKPLLSIAISHHPFGWEKSFYNIYFIILINMTKQCYHTNNLNEKWIKTYFIVMRTCYEIIKENKYNVNKLVKKYIDDISLRIHNKSDINVLLGQILCADIKIELLDEIIEKIFSNIFITKKIKSIGHNAKYIEYLKDMNTIDEIKNDLDEYFNQINAQFNDEFKTIIYVYEIKKILNNVNTIDQIMKQIDDNNSLITNDIIKLIKENIKEYTIDIYYLYQMRNIDLDWKAVVLRYFLDSLNNSINNYTSYTFDELLKLNYNNEINKNITFNNIV
jgi:hypothetical protein